MNIRSYIVTIASLIFLTQSINAGSATIPAPATKQSSPQSTVRSTLWQQIDARIGWSTWSRNKRFFVSAACVFLTGLTLRHALKAAPLPVALPTAPTAPTSGGSAASATLAPSLVAAAAPQEIPLQYSPTDHTKAAVAAVAGNSAHRPAPLTAIRARVMPEPNYRFAMHLAQETHNLLLGPNSDGSLSEALDPRYIAFMAQTEAIGLRRLIFELLKQAGIPTQLSSGTLPPSSSSSSSST